MKYLLGISWVVLIAMLLILLANIFDRYILTHYQYFMPVLFGMAAYFFSLMIVPYHKYQFINTFFHEMAHLIFAILTLAKPKRIVVTSAKEGKVGSFTYTSFRFLNGVHDHLIALAPYFFIPLTLTCAFIIYLNQPENWVESLIVSQDNIKMLLFFIGFSYAYHLCIIIIQASPTQSDFNNVGYLYGLIFALFMHLLFVLLVITLISSNFGTVDYIFSYHNFQKLKHSFLQLI